MKKNLFSTVALTIATIGISQTVVFEDNFDAGFNESNWTQIDADGDGQIWRWTDLSTADPNPYIAMSSYSWYSGLNALTPDNYLVTKQLDIPADGATLTYKVIARDKDWDKEKYTVYVSTAGNTADEFLATDPVFHEESLDGVNALTERTIDLSAYAGQQIYIAFRHWGVSDQFSMAIDDVKVASGTTSVSDIADVKGGVQVYPNPAVDVVNVVLSKDFDANKTTATLSSIEGRTVATFNNVSEINVNKLPAGVYVLTITDGVKTETKKIIKK